MGIQHKESKRVETKDSAQYLTPSTPNMLSRSIPTQAFTIFIWLCFSYITFSLIHSSNKGYRNSQTRLFSTNKRKGVQGVYLERLVERKKIEVDTLLRQHQEPDDPLVMRMGYVVTTPQYRVAKALRREAEGKDELHAMNVCVDVKRRSPTVADKRNIVEFSSAGNYTSN